MIVPRFGGHAGLAAHALLGLLVREIPDGRVHAVPVVVALDVSEQRLPRFGLRRPSPLMDEFNLEGVEEALHRGIIVAIAGAIIERFSWDTTIPKDAVKAQVEDGWVSLRGELRWHFEKEAAEAAVRTLAGVIGVINHVTVTPRVDVVDVGNDIRTALHRSWFFDGDTIKVSVDGGTVRLTGSVDTLHDRRVAERTAWAAPGAVKVENLLEVV